MTDNNIKNDRGYPDDKLDHLIELGEAFPRMPENLKARIRSRLVEMEPKPARRRFLSAHWSVCPLAATAVLAFFLIIFWHGGSPGNISWADVLKKLEQISTVTGISSCDISTSDGKRFSERSIVYYKDPGLSRSETYIQDSDFDFIEPGAELVIIIRRTPDGLESLTLHPGSKRAERQTHIILTNGPDAPIVPNIDAVADTWNRLKSITADNAKYIGDRMINGKSAIGFETEASALDTPESAYGLFGKGRIQVWVGRDDAIPLCIEIECQDEQGQNVHIEFSEIQWNIALEESLFDLVVPEDWALQKTRIETAEYTHTGFTNEVNLLIGTGLIGQGPTISARDVTGVIRSEQITNSDSNVSYSTQITIGLKPDAARSLKDYANAHPEKSIIVNFDGKINVAGRLDVANPTQLSFDLNLLDLSLAELETKYFTNIIERKNLP
jgi:hypothetical protein